MRQMNINRRLKGEINKSHSRDKTFLLNKHALSKTDHYLIQQPPELAKVTGRKPKRDAGISHFCAHPFPRKAMNCSLESTSGKEQDSCLQTSISQETALLERQDMAEMALCCVPYPQPLGPGKGFYSSASLHIFLQNAWVSW